MTTGIRRFAALLHGSGQSTLQAAARSAAGPPPRVDTTHHARPPLGQHAAAVLHDSLSSLPDRAEDWVTHAAGAAVRMLPRIALALVVAIVVLLLARLGRRAVRRYQDATGAPRRGDGLGLMGVLAAGAMAAAILGAATLAAALLTFFVFYVAALAAQLIGDRLFRRSSVGPGAVELLLSVLRTALVTIGAVEALSTIGLNLTGVIASLGIAGLAVGFAAQDTLANLIAGFTILWDRPFHVDDWIQVGEGSVPGRVRHLTLRTTRLETIDLGVLIIPNKDITGSRVFNYSLLAQGRLRLFVGVAADADIEQARRVVLDVARADERVDRATPPVVNVVAASDSVATLELVVATRDLGQARTTRSSLLEGVLAAFRARGLKYMAPSPPTDAGRGPW